MSRDATLPETITRDYKKRGVMPVLKADTSSAVLTPTARATRYRGSSGRLQAP